MQKNRSGQAVYFALVSAISGNPVTGASGAISGRKSLDLLSGLIVLSGNIIELGGGSYRANLYDFDTNGDQVGYFFSASGCVPVQYQFDMIDGNGSGHIFLGSGSITSGLIASGIVFIASGPRVEIPIATLSGVVANSGLTVTVIKETISGVIANSGLFVTVPPATISGVVANSGLNTNANVIRVAGSSGAAANLGAQYGVSPRATVDDTNAATTAFVFEVNNLLSGDSQAAYAGQELVALGVTNSGFYTTVRATAAPNSGRTQLTVFPGLPLAPASGDQLLAVGVAPYRQTSGGYVAVQSGQLSGQGVVTAASGVFATVPIATISGAIGNSGQFVTLPKETISGVIANSGIFVAVPIATISGVIANSGLFVTVPIATISGVVANSGLFTIADVRFVSGSARAGQNLAAQYGVVPVSVVDDTNAATTQFTFEVNNILSGASQLPYVGQELLCLGVANSGFYTVVRATAAPNSGRTQLTVYPGLPLAPGSGDRMLHAGVEPYRQTSGGYVAVQSGQLSGQEVVATAQLASGTVFLASGHGFYLSGQIFLASGSITSGLINSGIVFIASGPNVVATASVASGSLYLASGSIFRETFASGVIGCSGGFPQAWGNSGMTKPASGTAFIASGPFVNVPKETISGVVVNSGLTVTVIKETISGVVANSGLFVTVPKETISGVIANSGLFVTVPIATISGAIGNSGQFVTVPIETISGVIVNSGLFVTVPKATISGVVANSGLFVNATASIASGDVYLASGHFLFGSGQYYLNSGQNVNVFSGQLSGQLVTPASGAFGTASLNSGQSVLVASGQLSGQQVTARTVSDKSGYTLHSSGLDPVLVESGVNARQALAVIGAAVAGKLSGAGTALFAIQAMGNSGTLRISGAVDSSGNRTAVALNLP